MRKNHSPATWCLVIALGVVLGFAAGTPAEEAAEAPDWSIQASIIEACSCPMFCQCSFNPSPAGHGHAGHTEHFCRFNNAFQVASGSYGDVSLDGARFWVAGDLGADFSTGHMDWAVLTFDPAVTEAQRAAIGAILPHVYPVEWNSFTVAADAEMEWDLGETTARASLDGGAVAEVVLHRMANHATNPVIHGLNYWGLPRHEGFVLMPNEVEAYRAGDKAFEYSGGNGFTLTFDLTSADVAGSGGS
jgi:hypothetical protein